jgi:hypothetical protein
LKALSYYCPKDALLVSMVILSFLEVSEENLRFSFGELNYERIIIKSTMLPFDLL